MVKKWSLNLYTVLLFSVIIILNVFKIEIVLHNQHSKYSFTAPLLRPRHLTPQNDRPLEPHIFSLWSHFLARYFFLPLKIVRNTTLTTARRLVLDCGRYHDGVWRDRYLRLSRHIVFCQEIPQPAGRNCNCGRWHYSIWRDHKFWISWHVIYRLSHSAAGGLGRRLRQISDNA